MKRLVLALVLLVAAWVVWEVVTFPDTAKLAKEHPKTTAFMEKRRAELRAKDKPDAIRYQWVSYGKISPSFRRAVLVAEDSGFYDHKGVDMEAMREAFKRNWERRRITHGGSTITQQLAKNLYLSPSRNPLRKVREYFIARSLENNLSKKRILEIYLNVVELGERVYGAEAAARHYFGKSAAGLTSREAALLAGALPNPRAMSPAKPNRRLRSRQRMILARMRSWGMEYEREVLAETKPTDAEPREELLPEPPEESPATTPDEVIPDPSTDPASSEPAAPADLTTAEPPTTGTDGGTTAEPPPPDPPPTSTTF